MGNIDAIYELSECYYWGRGIDINYDKAVSLIRLGLDKENNNCLFLMGRAFGYGNGVDKDIDKAKTYYRRAIDECSDKIVIGKAQGNLANILWNESPLSEDKLEIVLLYESSMNNGNEISMENMGNYYYEGYNIKSDYEKAYYYLRQAAQHNNTNVYTRLGYMCQYGQGIKQDYEMAKYWYEKGIELNHSGCFNNLGSLYQNGQGVEQDYKRAFELYEKAAELESDYGMSSLAFL